MLLAMVPDGTTLSPGDKNNQAGKGTKGDNGDGTNTVGAEKYYLSDQLGNVIAMFDPFTGAVPDRYTYDAYSRRDCVSCDSSYNPMGFAGQYTDEESDLVYMRARYYDPTTEQFISRDPMVGTSAQPYVYANANPVNAADPSGEFWDWLFDWGFVGWDVADIANEGLNWGNGLTLAADVGLAIVPFVPAGVGLVSRGAKAASHAEHVVDAAGHSEGLTTVLGHFKRASVGEEAITAEHYTEYYIGREGYNVLNLPAQEWAWERNVEFLQTAIDRGDRILLVTPFTRILSANRVTGILERRVSVFEREQRWFIEQGYDNLLEYLPK